MKITAIKVGLLAAIGMLAGVVTGVAQSTAFTYQGHLTANGTNFTGAGQFKFALQVVTNTSSQAIVGIGELSGIGSGSIESCVVYYGGYGYTTPPAVTFSGGQPDATGTAVVNNGVVTAINITSGGYYPAEIFVSVAPPPANYTNFTIWNNDGTSGSQPVSAVTIGVTNGLFTAQVGNPALANMTAIPESIFLQTNLLLQIWFNDGVHGWAALNPAQALTATPYANFANSAGTLTGTLPTSQLIGSVPTSQLSGSVPAASLTGSVPTTSLTAVPAASLTGSVPSASLTAVPAASLTGSVPTAALTAVPAASLTGTLPAAVIPSPLAPPGVMNFGGALGVTEQMLNLYGTGYGIGVQANTEYFRTATGFAWYKGGTHNDGQNNSGGGTTLMLLSSSGLTVNGTFVNSSDRNAKEDFAAVNAQAVLDKVAAMPITQWVYKTDTGTRHIGPMAQDFYAAFNVGPDERHITTVDEGGVALAAIQGLNQKVEAKDAEIEALKQQNAALAAQLQALAAAVKTLAGHH